MINHHIEHLLSFAQAAKRLPARGDGKQCHPNTVARWAREGLSGVVLESIRIGGRRFTSQEACQRFFESLTAVWDDSAASEPPRLTAAQLKAAEEAGRQLEAAGV